MVIYFCNCSGRETIFITEPGSTLISDVRNFTYAANPLNDTIGELNGFVISDNDRTPMTVADLNAAGVFATTTLSGADGPVGTFPNTDIAASFQSDADGVPEPSTWAMMIVGFAGLSYVAFRRKPEAEAGRAGRVVTRAAQAIAGFWDI
jgi:hypothetical protein